MFQRMLDIGQSGGGGEYEPPKLYTVKGAVNETITVDDIIRTVTDSNGTACMYLPKGMHTFVCSISGKTYEVDVQDQEEILCYPSGAVYWYGNKIVDMTHSGFTYNSRSSLTPTYNTNSITMNSTAGNLCLSSSAVKVHADSGQKLYAIGYGSNQTYIGYSTTTAYPTNQTATFSGSTSTISLQLPSTDVYVCGIAYGGSATNMYALWIE